MKALPNATMTTWKESWALMPPSVRVADSDSTLELSDLAATCRLPG
jgi:phage host-nuclease inhibitor protein Gam